MRKQPWTPRRIMHTVYQGESLVPLYTRESVSLSLSLSLSHTVYPAEWPMGTVCHLLSAPRSRAGQNTLAASCDGDVIHAHAELVHQGCIRDVRGVWGVC